MVRISKGAYLEKLISIFASFVFVLESHSCDSVLELRHTRIIKVDNSIIQRIRILWSASIQIYFSKFYFMEESKMSKKFLAVLLSLLDSDTTYWGSITTFVM